MRELTKKKVSRSRKGLQTNIVEVGNYQRQIMDAKTICSFRRISLHLDEKLRICESLTKSALK